MTMYKWPPVLCVVCMGVGVGCVCVWCVCVCVCPPTFLEALMIVDHVGVSELLPHHIHLSHEVA